MPGEVFCKSLSVAEEPGSAVEALRAHRHLRGPYVFCQEDGQPHTNGTMKGPLERALRKADICREQGRIGWHDLRHTYSSHLAMKGIPLTVIKELMGHATIDMAVAVLDCPLAPACDIRATRMEDAANPPVIIA